MPTSVRANSHCRKKRLATRSNQSNFQNSAGGTGVCHAHDRQVETSVIVIISPRHEAILKGNQIRRNHTELPGGERDNPRISMVSWLKYFAPAPIERSASTVASEKGR